MQTLTQSSALFEVQRAVPRWNFHVDIRFLDRRLSQIRREQRRLKRHIFWLRFRQGISHQ